MPENLPNKGAVVQKDMKTYAIIPYIPGGFIDPDDLKKIADLAVKYNAKTLKLTSAQRIAIIGIREVDIDNIWADLEMKPGGFIGSRVRPVKLCPGNQHCKKGLQDTIELSTKIDSKFMGREMPKKIKIGVSGCINSCSEPLVKDIGIFGTSKGWKLFVGGSGGRIPMIARELDKDLSDDEVLELIEKILEYYRTNSPEKRLGLFIRKIGFENFLKGVSE